MGVGKDRLGATYSITYHDGTGNVRGATYASITTQGHLVLTDPGLVPTAPTASKLILFVEDHAGRVLPATIGPSGIDKNIQPALFGNTTYVWLPSTSTTLSINWGTSWTAVSTGAAAAQATAQKAATNALTSMNRATFGTGTTGTGVAGVRSTNTVAWMGNGTGLGGFLFFARFGVETVSGTYRVLIGLGINTAVLGATVEPSALTTAGIFLIKDSADTTWQIFVRSATTANAKINTSITVTTGQILDLYIYSAPNSQSVKFHIKDGTTGTDLYVSPTAITTNLPANTLFLFAQVQMASFTGGTAKLLALNTMYIECDL